MDFDGILFQGAALQGFSQVSI